MPLPTFLTPLIGKGLNMVANAVAVKGKSWLKEKTGVDLSSGTLSSEDEMKLKQFQIQNETELIKIRLEEKKIDFQELESENNAITSRWSADLSSDSFLSKNIRPLSLIAIFIGYFLFAMMSAFGLDANESYVNLLGQWGMLIMGAYFGGRSLEKIIDMRNKK